MLNKLKKSLQSVLLSYSEVFFLKSTFSGLVILILTFLYPNIGLCGLVSIITAYLLAFFVGHEKEFLKSGYYTYNALLVGIAIGHLFSFSILTLLYICVSAIITFVLTIFLADVLSRFFNLPILSLPFVVVTSLIYLSASKFSNLYVNDLYVRATYPFMESVFPIWIEGFLKCIGAVIFMPYPFIGLCLLILIFVQSRILFVLASSGYYLGVYIQSLFVGNLVHAFSDLNAFNYPLIAMAVGGVFLIPSYKSFIFAMSGVAMSTVFIKSIDIFWSEYSIPVFTLPFLLVTTVLVYVLGVLKLKLKPVVVKNTPEETADHFYTQSLRYPKDYCIYLPFTDEWSVYQGFDGDWTHKGAWKYAYDFVKNDERGLTYTNKGNFLEDYYCFKKEVTSPVRGTVIAVADFFPDNPIGVVDTVNNWGNYVVIQDVSGVYVGVCHLAQFSIAVKPGDWVEVYQVIGLCGNSGYSPQPHIHIQCQTTSYLSSITIPFTFSGIGSSNDVYHHLTPSINSTVKPYFIQNYYSQVTNLILDEELIFEAYRGDKLLETITLKVKMDVDSTFYLERNSSRLYFGKMNSSFYFYQLKGTDSYLKALYKALPSMPLSYTKGKVWRDKIPISFLSKTKQFVLSFQQAFSKNSAGYNCEYTFSGDSKVVGVINTYKTAENTEITLDPYKRFLEVRVGDLYLKAI